MYHKNTVYILGAGASHHYGYPLGNQLIHMLLASLDDIIPIPVVRSNKQQVFYNETDSLHGRLYNFDLIKTYLLGHISCLERQDCKFIPSRNGGNKLQLFDGQQPLGLWYQNDFYCARIGELDKFSQLKERLLLSNPLSIDSFLRLNPDLNEVAKILIIYTLLKCEDPNIFDLNYKNKNEIDAWMPIVFNELTQGCSYTPRSVLDNNIDFVTFNYDLSLEFFLARIFKETTLFSEKKEEKPSIADEIIEFLLSRIHHVYGNLPTLTSLGQYGFYSDLNHTKDKTTNQFYRFLQSLLNHESILTINEERTNKNHEKMQELIKKAEIINIIGFAFDRDNLNVLGFPNTIDSWEKYVSELESDKTINYLNFDNKNSRLSLQFKNISKIDHGNFQIIVNESKANKISDALLYNFKTCLFEN